MGTLRGIRIGDLLGEERNPVQPCATLTPLWDLRCGAKLPKELAQG